MGLTFTKLRNTKKDHMTRYELCTILNINYNTYDLSRTDHEK
jgi:hypothetical protein